MLEPSHCKLKVGDLAEQATLGKSWEGQEKREREGGGGTGWEGGGEAGGEVGFTV